MSRLAIYYGRVRYVDPHPGQESFLPRHEPIRDAVEAAIATSTSRYGHEWVLGNVETDEATRLITGRLGYPATGRSVHQDYDEADHRFVVQLYDLPEAASSAFVLNYVTGAIAFEAHNKIRPSGFINHFVALLNETGKGQFRGELVRVAQDYKDFLRVVDKVTRVQFTVRPTNPRDRAIFRPLDEGLKAVNAERERVVIENEAEGLRIVPPASRDETTSNPAIQGIEMNEEGYGDGYRIDGEKASQPLRYDSKRGGLLRDVVEDAPEDPDGRLRLLREQFDERASLLAPGATDVPPLEATDESEAEEDREEWPAES